jgi:hypothetical protein
MNQKIERKQKLQEIKVRMAMGLPSQRMRHKLNRDIKETLMLGSHPRVTLVGERLIKRWKVAKNLRRP